MKQVLTAVLFLCFLSSFADTPGKAKMLDSKISFQNFDSIVNYTFFYQQRKNNIDSVYEIKDITVTIPGSGGVPQNIFFWGVNLITKKHTDTVMVSNYYSPNYVFILTKVENDSIYYTQKELSNGNNMADESNNENITNKELIADAKKAKQNHYLKIGGFITLGVAAFGGLVWFYRRKKNKLA